tara:strand:- start:7010 stop:7993 length:984 start_codon:yes stop_codon:yes gene_type:complete
MAQLIERDQIGVREDLSNLIENVDAATTPLLSRIKSGDAPGNTKLEWQVDDYPVVSITGVIDESDVGASDWENFSSRAKMHNYVQIFNRFPRVSRLAHSVSDVAGIGKKEMAHQIAKGLTMQKRDIEARFCSDDDAEVGTATQGYETRGLGSFISGTNSTNAPTPTGYTPASGQVDETTTLANVDDDTIRDILEAVWGNTGQPGKFLGLCGSAVKKKISDLTSFVQGTTVNANLNANKVTQIVDVIDGDFGVVELHLSTFLNVDTTTGAGDSNALYFLDMDKVEARYASRPSFRALEDAGGGPRGIIESIVGLVCTNPLGFGKLIAQ